MRILSAAEMREVDRLTTERLGVPSLTLMENAGSAVAAYCISQIKAQILIVCGQGNNGGDGLVAARHILRSGGNVQVASLASYDQVRGDAKVNLDALILSGLRPYFLSDFEQWCDFASSVPPPNILVDAIWGIGLRQPAEGFFAQVIDDINQRFTSAQVVAIDLPSGLNADSHEIIGPSIRADVTLTMTAPKICLAFPPAAELAGKVRVIPIGSPDSLVEEISKQKLHWLEEPDCRFVVKPRPVGSNKGAFGHALIIAGSVGKTGAAVLAGRAALRTGAGLVTVATALSAQPVVAQFMPEMMTIPLPETPVGSIDLTAFDYGTLDQAIRNKSVIAIGPGITTHPDTQEFVRRLVQRYPLPMILDADALNAFADHTHELKGTGRTLVLTPHPGEFARLIKTTPQVVQSDRKNFAREFATRHQVILVLKGFRSLIASPQGEVFVCPTGNPGMAKGGTGDALTGLLAGLMSQFTSEPAEKIVSAAVYLHGRAGDYACEQYGVLSMLAGDLIECLPSVFQDLAQSGSSLPSNTAL